MSGRLIKDEAKQTEIMHLLEIKDREEPTIILHQQIKKDYIKLHSFLEFCCLKNLVAYVFSPQGKIRVI